jgi:predicted PurR-regulated permease PerM
MQLDEKNLQLSISGDLRTTLVRIGIIISLVYLCAKVFSPFVYLILWAVILAVALFPLHQGLAKKLKGKQARAATVLILAGLLVIGIPSAMLGSSFASHISESYKAFENGTLSIKKPSPSIAEWPIVGEKIYKGWTEAADNLPGYVEEHQDKLKNISKSFLAAALNSTKSLLLFLASLIIAGIMMAYGESGIRSIEKIFSRVAGPIKGPELQNLSTATIRSVANGVIGVAFIQALLLGVGFILAGVPAAGILALIILFMGIAQLPAVIITLPVIAYIWSAGDASTASNIFFTVYLILAGTSDAFLKPILLGRGVNAPMPIILIGALGGMVTAGIIGLFVGAVVLTIGYIIFMAWVNDEQELTDADQVNKS